MPHPTTPRLIIVCGLPGSGKTTLADALVQESGAFRMSPDLWMETLGINLWESDIRDSIERIQWELTQQLLQQGQIVVIEWGTWGRSERDTLREGARALGAAVELHWLDEPIEELWTRLEARGLEDPPITRDQLEEWARVFQAPTAEELASYDNWDAVST
jgi:predicted kinase